MDDHRALARALHDHLRLGDIDEAVLVAGIVGIVLFALRDGDSDAALAVIAGLPDGWEAHVNTPPMQEAVQELAQAILDKGLVNEGVDVGIYGSLDWANKGPVS